MVPTDRDARTAGALYLLVGLTAPFGLIYVPSRILVPGNATATAANLRAHEMLFRCGIVTSLASTVIFLFTVLALYRLLRGVNSDHAAVMVVLGLASVPIAFVTSISELAALTVARGASFLSVFDRPQLDALAMTFLRLRGNGVVVNEIFWGMWLFPFGLLVIRSGFIPRILGILLIVNGAAYVVASLTGLLLPAYAPMVNRWVMIPETGELWIMFWLLIKGANARAPEPLPAAA